MFYKSIFLMVLIVACCGFDNLDYGCPGMADQVVDRVGYALGYSDEHEQPLWVSYRLTSEEVDRCVVGRHDCFSADDAIVTGSAEPSDYRRSGYDRGHLAPARDMLFDMTAMRESFFMSNTSPQIPAFNRGVWARLEMVVREIARRERSVVVVTGPIFDERPEKIGRNNVSVPRAFYKVVYGETQPCKMYAFIVPHCRSKGSVWEHACSVDDVEVRTGLDFFSALPAEQQLALEVEVRNCL